MVFFPSHLCFWQLTECLQLSVEGILFAQDMWLGCIFSWPHCGDSRLCHEWFPFHWNPKVSLPETWLLSYTPVISCKQCGGVTGLCVQLVDYLSSNRSKRLMKWKEGRCQKWSYWQWHNAGWCMMTKRCLAVLEIDSTFSQDKKILASVWRKKKRVLKAPFINQLTDIRESLFVEEGERCLKPLFCQCFHAN